MVNALSHIPTANAAITLIIKKTGNQIRFKVIGYPYININIITKIIAIRKSTNATNDLESGITNLGKYIFFTISWAPIIDCPDCDNTKEKYAHADIPVNAKRG
jgi:hypothetical protein